MGEHSCFGKTQADINFRNWDRFNCPAASTTKGRCSTEGNKGLVVGGRDFVVGRICSVGVALARRDSSNYSISDRNSFVLGLLVLLSINDYSPEQLSSL